jgi:hypothetical protein
MSSGSETDDEEEKIWNPQRTSIPCPVARPAVLKNKSKKNTGTKNTCTKNKGNNERKGGKASNVVPKAKAKPLVTDAPNTVNYFNYGLNPEKKAPLKGKRIISPGRKGGKRRTTVDVQLGLGGIFALPPGQEKLVIVGVQEKNRGKHKHKKQNRGNKDQVKKKDQRCGNKPVKKKDRHGGNTPDRNGSERRRWKEKPGHKRQRYDDRQGEGNSTGNPFKKRQRGDYYDRQFHGYGTQRRGNQSNRNTHERRRWTEQPRKKSPFLLPSERGDYYDRRLDGYDTQRRGNQPNRNKHERRRWTFDGSRDDTQRHGNPPNRNRSGHRRWPEQPGNKRQWYGDRHGDGNARGNKSNDWHRNDYGNDRRQNYPNGAQRN